MADASDFSELRASATSRQIISGNAHRVFLWVAGAAGALLFVIWALAGAWLQPVTATDVEQQRLNIALAPPTGDRSLVQLFRPRHDGLREVEILLARNGEGQEGQLTLQLVAEDGVEIARQRWEAGSLRHNQPLVLHFAAQPHSAGREYRLIVRGEGDNPFGAWAYDFDVYEGGALVQAPGEVSGDLRFTTRYQLSAGAALQQVGHLVVRDGVVLLLSLLVLPLPGCLALLAARRRLPAMDVGAWWSVALALSLALWPLLWFWLTLAGGRWTRPALAVVVVAGWLAAIFLFLRNRRQFCTPLQRHAVTPLHYLLLILLLIALAVRLLAVRDLAFPPWVDSSRHALITTIMVEQGQTPDGYRPYLPVDDFAYHFGFHTLAAGVQMLGGQPLPRTLLALGQLLNALAALGVYGGAWLLTRRRCAALLAAFLVALPFFFPAYYVTWGRFTQLTGALLLAPLLALTWLLVRGSRGWRRAWWLVGILAAGLFLVHLRVFLIYVPFGVLAGVAVLGRGRWLRALGGLAAAALLGILLVAPRLWELVSAVAGSGYLSSSGASYADFPVGYVTTGWERWFLILGGLAFLGLAGLTLWPAGSLRRGSRALVGVVLGGWAGIVALLLSGRVPGLPALWLINLNSAYILVFVPLSLLLALGFALLWSWLASPAGGALRRVALLGAAMALGAGIAAATIFGAQQQTSIVNETTVLAREEDREALAWMATNLPREARVAVNGWRWLGETWAAGDGGAWLLPVTGLEATTPPVDYIGDRELFQGVIAFNEGATAVEDWSEPAAATWLVQKDVSHVYVGRRGGFLDPAQLARNPRIRVLYEGDGVFVFGVGE